MADRRPDPARQVARLAGFAPSLPKPFRDTGELDSAALEWLCHRQVEESAAALVVCGVTAEAPTLTQGERETILRIAVDASRGRIPVIAAVASNSTSKAIEFAKAAQAAGAAAVLAVVPYYNKPTQSGMYALAAMIASVGVALARESDPAPVKYALSLMRLVSSRMRLPLVEVTNHTRAEIKEALARIATEHPGYLVGNVSRNCANGPHAARSRL